MLLRIRNSRVLASPAPLRSPHAPSRGLRLPCALAVAVNLAGLAVVLCCASVNANCIDYGDYLHWLGSVQTPASIADGVTVSGNYAYVTVDLSGLQIIDITDPRTPRIVGSVDTLRLHQHIDGARRQRAERLVGRREHGERARAIQRVDQPGNKRGSLDGP